MDHDVAALVAACEKVLAADEEYMSDDGVMYPYGVLDAISLHLRPALEKCRAKIDARPEQSDKEGRPMSFQDIHRHYQDGTPDDLIPVVTIPECPTPGERFIEVHTNGSCDVYDWLPDTCHGCCSGGSCQGDGCGSLSPELLVAGLCEEDARLLAFGLQELARAKAELSAIRGRLRMYRRKRGPAPL